jgi:hypothetical protein
MSVMLSGMAAIGLAIIVLTAGPTSGAYVRNRRSTGANS